MKAVKWLDAHTHLDSDDLYHQKAEILQRAKEAGIQRLLLVNSEATEQSFVRTLEFAGQPSGMEIFLALGIHPHHAFQYDSRLESKLLEMLGRPGIVALGEIGLDFYYNFSPPDVQKSIFRRQLQLAQEKQLPVVIHCRDAYGELADMLWEMSSHWRGMIHCFTGTPEEADDFLNLGFYISFSGVVTFKKADVLREAARKIPPDRILVETDAPYLAPVPYRGKRNEPAFVVETAKVLAQIRGVDLNGFAQQVWENFDRLFLGGGRKV